jgi:hypothetical protein
MKNKVYTMTDINFYRYYWREHASIGMFGEAVKPTHANPHLYLSTYVVYKETPKGYWIKLKGFSNFDSKGKWIPKEAKKRFAYPTKKEALNAFVSRTKSRVKILNRTIDCCNIAIIKAEHKLQKIKDDE